MPSSFDDRRRSARGLVRRLGRIECRKGPVGNSPNLAVLTMDLCEIGVQIVTRELLNPGQEVEIQLCGAGLIKAVRRLGKVIWSCPFQAAAPGLSQLAAGLSSLAGIAFDQAVPPAKINRLLLPEDDLSNVQSPMLLTIFRPNSQYASSGNLG
jgi:hypothetical protein